MCGCDLMILLCCMKARSEDLLSVQLAFELCWYQRQQLRQALLGADECGRKLVHKLPGFAMYATSQVQAIVPPGGGRCVVKNSGLAVTFSTFTMLPNTLFQSQHFNFASLCVFSTVVRSFQSVLGS